jgi:alkylation response protein AidB-like acyl-CoA dehydrogenase
VDLDLTREERDVATTFERVLARESSIERVRAAEAIGFDRELWSVLAELNVIGMVTPEDAGGLGGGFVELALVAESVGRHLACAPVVEAAVAARLIAEAGGEERLLGRAVAGELVVVFAPAGVRGVGVAEVAPAGAVADGVVTLDGDELVLALSPPTDPVGDLGFLAMGERALAGAGVERLVLATGGRANELWTLGVGWWRLASAAACAGLALLALDTATTYARTREQFGVPIGSFQAIQTMLADVAMAADGGLLLAREAAWSHDQGGSRWLQAADTAYAHNAETAVRAAEVCVHVHGGYGFTLEYDAQLFLRRAKAMQLVGGDPDLVWQAVGAAALTVRSS